MIRVGLVDDHALVRAGVGSELAAAEGILEVVVEAGSVKEAVDRLTASRPDVVVCDVHLPDGTAADVITQVQARGVESQFLALSVSDAAEDVIGVIRAGARGYVTKAISGDDLIDAVRRVHEGDAVFSPRLAGFVLDAFTSTAEAPADPELDQLTSREQEVMRLLARGYAYKAIARRLNISIKTVESHASAVLRKLQLSSRNELAAWAANRQII